LSPHPFVQGHHISFRSGAALRSSTVVASLLLIAAVRASAQQVSPIVGVHSGERLRIDAPGEVRHHFVGTLLFPPSDTLLLASPDGAPVTVHPGRITSLEVSRGKSSFHGAIRGLLIGAPLGLLLGFIAGNEPEQQCYNCPVKRRSMHDITAGALAGAASGSLIGAFVGREQWIAVPIPGRGR
jgi:hypothetical protein